MGNLLWWLLDWHLRAFDVIELAFVYWITSEVYLNALVLWTSWSWRGDMGIDIVRIVDE